MILGYLDVDVCVDFSSVAFSIPPVRTLFTVPRTSIAASLYANPIIGSGSIKIVKYRAGLLTYTI